MLDFGYRLVDLGQQLGVFRKNSDAIVSGIDRIAYDFDLALLVVFLQKVLTRDAISYECIYLSVQEQLYGFFLAVCLDKLDEAMIPQLVDGDVPFLDGHLSTVQIAELKDVHVFFADKDSLRA